MMGVMILLVLIVLGLCLGSFVNALVWRLHAQSQTAKSTGKGRKLSTTDLSVLRGRSMCPDCHHTLTARDLVPVLSWLSLGGKCRYCRRPISGQYPVVELFTAVLFVVSYLLWPFTWSTAGVAVFAVWLLLLVVFMALVVYDVRWMLLPDKLVLAASVGAVLFVFLQALAGSDAWLTVGDSAVGALVIGGMFFGLFELSKGRWLGGGDVKLAPALGLLAGSPLKALLVIFFASVIGLLVALPLLVRRKATRRSLIPFGPCLLAATVLVVLLGDVIIRAYLAVFGLD
jgi:prepilin signal peptidase PulO-like enzyme (type II secretory pathway)